MIYARGEDNKMIIASSRDVVAYCPDCGERVIPKVGRIKSHHFAHKNHSNCPSTWEPMSQWHYDWQHTIKNPVGGVNIEVKIVSGLNYKRADLVNKNGLIIEFQKSSISVDEIIERESKYQLMIWVVHKNLEKSKVWNYTNHPVYIDCGQYLYKMNSYEKISRNKFISRFINCDFFIEDYYNNNNINDKNILKNFVDAF